MEGKGKKKSKKGKETFGFEDLDQQAPKTFSGIPDRNANLTPFGDFGGRKVFIGGTADKVLVSSSQSLTLPPPPSPSLPLSPLPTRL